MQNLRLKDLEVVVFDWDNTLAKTRDALVFSINKVLESYSMPLWNEVGKLRNKDLSFQDNFVNIFGKKAEEAYQKYSEIYEQNVTSYVKKPEGADEVLDILKKYNKKIAIMTNKDRRLFELEFSSLYDPKIFDKIVCGHEAKRDKPYPEHAFYTLEGLVDKSGINSKTVWIIGDSHQDVECALNSKTLPILIGKPIWEEEVCEKNNIIYFKDFVDFSKSIL